MDLDFRGKESESDMQLLTKMELSVNMNCESCADRVRAKLLDNPGVHKVHISVPEQRVVVDTTLKTSEIQALLETTGFLVFFKGFGGEEVISEKSDRNSAVVILKGKGIGLVRMVQTTPGSCVIEATLDKMIPTGEYLLNVHQLGDVSLGGESCGEVYGVPDEGGVPIGYLGQARADENGKASLHVVSNNINVLGIIGRSVVVASQDTNTRLMCGVIARSAGLFQNSKKLCTCDGVTIWDEAQKKLVLNN